MQLRQGAFDACETIKTRQTGYSDDQTDDHSEDDIDWSMVLYGYES